MLRTLQSTQTGTRPVLGPDLNAQILKPPHHRHGTRGLPVLVKGFGLGGNIPHKPTWLCRNWSTGRIPHKRKAASVCSSPSASRSSEPRQRHVRVTLRARVSLDFIRAPVLVRPHRNVGYADTFTVRASQTETDRGLGHSPTHRWMEDPGTRAPAPESTAVNVTLTASQAKTPR